VLELDEEQGAGPEAPSTSEETPSGLGLLLGTVVDAESGAPVESFSVALLGERRENRPDVARPSRHRDEQGTFRREEIAFGEWSVFVHAEGYALLHAGKLRFSADEPVHEVRAELSRGAQVRGYVVEAASGDPVAGAQVLSERDTPAWGLPFHEVPLFSIWMPVSTRSRSDGSFTLPHLSPGNHVLKVSASGHAPARSEELVVVEGGRLDGLEIALGEGGTIEGRVTDSAGRPVRGAMLIAFQADGSMSYAIDSTDAQGRYELRDLPTGMLLVVLTGGVDGEEDLPEVKPCAVEPGATATVDFLGERTGTRLTGRLLDPSGAPIGEQNLACFSAEDVQFRGDWQATSTSPEGRYAFDDLEPGSYLIHHVGSMGTSLFLVGEVDLPPVAELEHDLQLGAFRLEGRVVDAVTEEPVAGGFLLLERRTPTASRTFAGYVTTDGEGRYAFEHLPQGTYRLVAYPPIGALGFEEEPSIELGPERPGALRDFALWPGGTVRVTVVDPDGRPVAGAYVSLLGEDDRTFEFSEDPVTDARGVHEAFGCRPGSFRVRVEHGDYREATESTECREGERTDLRVVLRPDSGDER
jgi:protocatechuate 3,4-dioxygenase beta subunit